MQSACRRISPCKGTVAAQGGRRRAKGDRRWSWVRVVELFAREGTGECCEEGSKSDRVGGLGPRAPLRAPNGSGVTSLGLYSFSFSLVNVTRREAGKWGAQDPRRGGRAAYDPARRVPRVSSHGLPRTIDNEPMASQCFTVSWFLCKLFVWHIGGSIVQVDLSTLNVEKVYRGIQIDHECYY